MLKTGVTLIVHYELMHQAWESALLVCLPSFQQLCLEAICVQNSLADFALEKWIFISFS